MSLRDGSVGLGDFVERHGFWGAEEHEAAARAASLIEEHGIEVVRFSFADQHGILRGKAVFADSFALAVRNGVAITTTLLAKDTSHRTVFPVFTAGGGFGMPEMAGAGDAIMVPDPKTFRILPWTQGTAWVLCDIYFQDGRPVPFSSRQILRDTLDRLGAQGYDFVSGLELEFHIFQLDDPMMRPEDAGQPAAPPEVSLLAHGYQYLTENRLDELDAVLEFLRRDLMQLDLPLRGIEAEFGPSQVEISLHPCTGIETADAAMLFRGAVKQICRRHGYHATFMCKPNLPNLFASGWHLHQSLRDRKTGANAFIPEAGAEDLSPLGMQYLAGLLANARAASVFTAPTINGYKRYQFQNALAPDRANWGRDNKGAMVRTIGGAGEPATRIENRIGESAANPYLYAASQIISGMDGVARGLEPPPAAESPYQTDAPALPRSLMDSVAALKQDELFRGALGEQFVDYIVTIKEAEIGRFLSEVTDWEHREYFEIF